MISKQGENLVFLLGVPRSGTTLLSVMLDAHSQVRCPPEPWLMLALESLGRVSAHSSADAPVLYRAVKTFCDPATAIAAARSYAIAAYNKSLNGSGKKILVDKTPRYYLILSYLAEVFPKAKYVILWRNPLDIAASIRTTWQVDVTAHLARWEDHLTCMDLVLGLRRLLDFSAAQGDRVYTMQYEKLVRQPEKSLGALLKWLDLPQEPITGFQLAGGEFDKGDIGDKKILSTTAPHPNSIGRWSKAFTTAEISILLQSIGPHVISAMGYAKVMERALSKTITAPDPAHSNTYAQQLERSLAARNAEYQSAATFCDLTSQERRLHRALVGSAPVASLPVPMDLATQFRAASDAAEKLSAAMTRGLARVDELEREGSAATTRLDEARNLARAQLDHSASRETDWTNKFAAQTREIEAGQSQLADFRAQIQGTESRLKDALAEHAAQRLTLAATTEQLQLARGELEIAINDLATQRDRATDLTQQLQEEGARLADAAQEIERQRAQSTDLTEQLRRMSDAKSAADLHVQQLSAQLSEAGDLKRQAESRLAEVDAERDSLRSQTSIRIRELESERDELKIQSGKHSVELESLRNQSEKRIAELDSVQAQSEKRIADLDLIKAEKQKRIAELEIELQQARADSDSRISGLEAERDSLRAESDRRISELKDKVDSLHVEIRNVTHTRLWRMVGTVYPVYQRTIQYTFLPQLAKLPVQAIHNWLAQLDKED